jgi:hypothetical protein
MGIRKDAFLRDMTRVVVANMLAAQKEWAEVIREVGPDVEGALRLIKGNPHRFPNISYDRIPVDRVRELVSAAKATAPSRDPEVVGDYVVRYLKAKKADYGFEVTPTDEKNLKDLFSSFVDLQQAIEKIGLYINSTQIKRDYDRVYVTSTHRRRLASSQNLTFVYGVVLQYLDSLDRGF